MTTWLPILSIIALIAFVGSIIISIIDEVIKHYRSLKKAKTRLKE